MTPHTFTALCLIATPVAAQDSRVWSGFGGPDSVLSIHAPTSPDAIATVTFDNTNVHAGNDAFSLTYLDITVGVEFGFNVDALGSESVTIYPPDGYAAIPSTITVREDDTGVVQIVEWIGG